MLIEPRLASDGRDLVPARIGYRFEFVLVDERENVGSSGIALVPRRQLLVPSHIAGTVVPNERPLFDRPDGRRVFVVWPAINVECIVGPLTKGGRLVHIFQLDQNVDIAGKISEVNVLRAFAMHLCELLQSALSDDNDPMWVTAVA